MPRRGQRCPVESVRVGSRCPATEPHRLLAVNYMEDGTRPNIAPINAFTKSAPNAIVGPGTRWSCLTVGATIFEGDAGMALVIGKARDWRAAAEARTTSSATQLHRRLARGVPAF